MRHAVRQGRANYEPNSWGEGPRESPEVGYRHFPPPRRATKLRIRPESFADHYSQARQFFVSQTDVEQTHIANALVFELCKVRDASTIRARMVAHLLNIDEDLAKQGRGRPPPEGDAEARARRGPDRGRT